MANPNISAETAMVDLRAFRLCNSLKQRDISEFLNLTVGFISAVERGASRLPTEQLAKLLENDKGWDTTYLLHGDPMRGNHYDSRHIDKIMQNFESPNNCPINQYQGYSKEDVEREVNQKLSLATYQIEVMEKEIRKLEEENAYLRSVNERYLRIIEGKSSVPSPETAAPEEEKE